MDVEITIISSKGDIIVIPYHFDNPVEEYEIADLAFELAKDYLSSSFEDILNYEWKICGEPPYGGD